MLEFLSVQMIEIAVGVIVALILLGGSGAYIAYRVWAKKHGKSACDGNCAHCAGCHVISLEEQRELTSDKQKDDVNTDKTNGGVNDDNDKASK